MKNKLLPLIIISFFARFAFAGELQAVVYSSGGQLCSVSPKNKQGSCLDLFYCEAAWKPHGNILVAKPYVDEGQENGLVLLNNRGQKIKALEHSVGFMRPIWNPDGKYIYALQYDLGPKLGRWNSDGTHFQIVPVTGQPGKPGDYQMISFSPSGRRVALLNLEFNQLILARVNDNKFTFEKCFSKGFVYIAESVWLDENDLLFVGRTKEGDSAYLWQLNADDGTTHKVVIPGLSLRDFIALSPDRKSIVMCATKDGEELAWSLWEFTFGLSTPTRLTTGMEDVEVTWGE